MLRFFCELFWQVMKTMNVFKHSIVFLSENRKHENSTKQTTQFVKKKKKTDNTNLSTSVHSSLRAIIWQQLLHYLVVHHHLMQFYLYSSNKIKSRF